MTFSASAPGRCGIVGNPSDIYGGKVLSCSIDARNHCRLTLGEDAMPDDTTLWDAATRRFPIVAPVRVEWRCEVPRSSGLSGSTALLAATLAAIHDARGERIEDFRAFAEEVRDIERNEAGIMCGYQDAYMTAHGGLQLMDFAGKHPERPGPFATLTPIDALTPFLLITTGVERLSGSVHGPMAKRWMEGDREVVGAIEEIQKLPEPVAAALASGDLKTVAEAMALNHRRIAELGGSGDAIETLIAYSLRHGALAAKLAGAGMGGTVIALTEDADGLERKLRGEGYSRFLRPKIQPGVQIG